MQTASAVAGWSEGGTDRKRGDCYLLQLQQAKRTGWTQDVLS